MRPILPPQVSRIRYAYKASNLLYAVYAELTASLPFQKSDPAKYQQYKSQFEGFLKGDDKAIADKFDKLVETKSPGFKVQSMFLFVVL